VKNISPAELSEEARLRFKSDRRAFELIVKRFYEAKTDIDLMRALAMAEALMDKSKASAGVLCTDTVAHSFAQQDNNAPSAGRHR
jgi:hypothetical protein